MELKLQNYALRWSEALKKSLPEARLQYIVVMQDFVLNQSTNTKSNGQLTI